MTNAEILKELPNKAKHQKNLAIYKNRLATAQNNVHETGQLVFVLKDVTEVYENTALHIEETGDVTYINPVGDDNPRTAEVWHKQSKIVYLRNGKTIHIGNFNGEKYGPQFAKDWIVNKAIPKRK